MANRDNLNFKKFFKQVEERVYFELEIKVGKIKGEITKVLNQKARLFFKKGVVPYLDQTEKPSFVRTPWKPLAFSTMKRKQGNTFFKDTGRLIKRFNYRSPISMYGKPDISVTRTVGSKRVVKYELFRGLEDLNSLENLLDDEMRRKLDTKGTKIPYRSIMKPAFRYFLKMHVNKEIIRTLKTKGLIK